MDTINTPQPQNLSPDESKSGNIKAVFIACAVLILVIIAFYLGTTYSKVEMTTTQKPNAVPLQSQTSISEAPTNPLANTTPTKPPPVHNTQAEIDVAIKYVEENLNPKMIVEALDINANKNIISFIGHSEDWKEYGIYTLNKTTNTTLAVYKTTESIAGRGGSYMDNVALQFAPDGNTFYVNKTGINFPSFFIVTTDGKVLLKSNTYLGHPTWVSDAELVYIKDQNQPPFVYNVITKTEKQTKLPQNVFLLKANSLDNIIMAIAPSSNPMLCQTFDITAYSYPQGEQIAKIKNTTLTSKWVGQDIEYEQVTKCIKNTGESMFEYSPLTELKTFSIGN